MFAITGAGVVPREDSEHSVNIRRRCFLYPARCSSDYIFLNSFCLSPGPDLSTPGPDMCDIKTLFLGYTKGEGICKSLS